MEAFAGRTVKDLALEMGFARTYLSRKLAASWGYAPSGVLRALRLRKAEALLRTTSLTLATVAAAGLVGNPVGGALGDRIGPRRTLALGLVLAAAGTASLAAVHNAAHAFAAAALYGLGSGIAWPAQDALLATLVTPEQRSAAFSVRHATLNAGLGAGAVIGALAVSLASPSALPALYLLDALSTLAFVPLVLRLED